MILTGRATLLMLIGAVMLSPAACAHGDADWMHGMVDGALQFFISVPSLLPVLMVALLARRHSYRLMAIQAAALGVGLLVALLNLPIPGGPASLELYARGLLIALALLVLLDLRLHAGLVLVLSFVTGASTGLESKAAVIDGPATGSVPAVGFCSAAILVYLLAGLIAGRYPLGWQRIAIRVVASWIAAIAAIDVAFMIGRDG